MSLETETETSYDPYRALAAAIVYQAMLDAFCANVSQEACRWYRIEAYDWLLSDDGRRMAEWSGLDAGGVVARLRELRAQGLSIRPRSKAIVWVRQG